jgi:phage anti-repressor protein
MPKGKSSADSRVSDLKKMSGTDFAMEVTKDIVMLPKEERGKAIRMLTALNETINRETEALATR